MNNPNVASETSSPMAVTQRDAARAFAKIGFLSFGGPAAQIAVMHRVLVEERQWLSERQFLHALNFCMVLPGPEAMQLATYAGWLLHGVRGGVVAGLLFIAPGLVMMLALSALYVTYGDMPVLAGIFYGLKAAVIAVVLQALVRLGQKGLSDVTMLAVAVVSFFAIFFLRVPFPVIIMAAVAIGIVQAISAGPANAVVADTSDGRAALGQSVRAGLLWGAIWLVPLGLIVWVLHPSLWSQIALFFSQTAVVTFGGAYAVLAYVGQQAVDAQGWISADDMLAGLGLAETTLGPLVLVLVFVGFVAGAGASGDMALAGGMAGGLLAAFFTFAPCFLWIFAGAPHIERLRGVSWLSGALKFVTAAVVGVIANLAVWFALAVLFGQSEASRIWLLYVPSIALANLDWVALAIGIGASVALLRFQVNLFVVLGVSALAGLVATLL